MQGYELFSVDLSTFLILQNDQNLVLYNTTLVNSGIGRSAQAVLFYSNTYNPNPIMPLSLTMQAVRGDTKAAPFCNHMIR